MVSNVGWKKWKDAHLRKRRAHSIPFDYKPWTGSGKKTFGIHPEHACL